MTSDGDWVDDLVQTYKMKDILSFNGIDCEVQKFLNTEVLELFSSDETSNVEIDTDYFGD